MILQRAWTNLLGVGAALALLLPVQAQEPDELPAVFVDVSMEAKNRLASADALVKDGQFGEALETLQRLIEHFGDKVGPAGPASPNIYVSLASLCHERIAKLSPEGLRLYRSRFDGQAAQLLENAEKSGDAAILERIANEYFCTAPAPKAIERLGDRALARGRCSEAINWWSMLLGPEGMRAPPAEAKDAPKDRATGPIPLLHPDPVIDEPRLAAKWIIAQRLQGNELAASKALAAYRIRFPDAKGRLAGKEGNYSEILAAIIEDRDTYEPAVETSDWPTFAGNFARNRVAPKPLAIGAVQYRWPIGDKSQGVRRIPDPNEIRARADDSLPYFPVIAGKKAFMLTERRLVVFDLETGQDSKWNQDGNADDALTGAGILPQEYSLTVAGPRLFIRTGRIFNENFIGRGQPSRGNAQSKLICVEHRTERALWTISASEQLGNKQDEWIFGGPPVVDGDSAYVAVVRLGVRSETRVVCLDIENKGQTRWQTYICEAPDDAGSIGILQNLLTFADGCVYYATNLGAVAALDARSGRIRWLATYPRDGLIRSPIAVTSKEAEPAVYHQGKLFVAAADSGKIRAFDSSTGETLWETNPPINHLLGVAKGNLIATGKRVWAIDVETGKIRWRWPENPVPGHGRGILAGDYVYWPTATEIHILDQASGAKAKPSIALFDRLHVGPGNMVAANGFLLLAQQKQVIAISQPGRLVEALTIELAKTPDSPELHFQLARAAFEDENFALAEAHFQKSAALAGSDHVVEGKRLGDFARDQLCVSRLKMADAAEARGQIAEARALLQAAGEGADVEHKIEVCERRASLAVRAKDFAAAAAVYQSVINDAELKGTMIPQGNVRVTAAAWAALKIDELVRVHGPDCYDAIERAADEALDGSADPAKLLEIVERFPNSNKQGERLVGAAQGLVEEKKLGEARALFERVHRSASKDGSLDIASLVGLERTSRELGWTEASGYYLDRLEFAYAKAVVPGSPRPVSDYVRERRSASDVPEDRPGRWERIGRLEAPGRHVPLAAGASANKSKLVFFSGNDRLRALDAATGKPRWESTIPGEILWVALTPAGLVVGTPASVSCHSVDQGTAIWKTTLSRPGAPTPWSPLRMKYARATARIPADRAASELPKDRGLAGCRFAVAGNMVFAGSEGTLLAIDGSDGSKVWSAELSANDNVDAIQLCGPVLMALVAEKIVGVESWSGRRILEVRCDNGAAAFPIHAAAGRAFLVKDRETIVSVELAGGELAWTQKCVSPAIESPRIVAADQKSVLAIIDGFQLRLFDAETGKPKWETAVGTKPAARRREAWAYADDRLAVIEGDWIECRSTEDGSVLWRSPVPMMDESATLAAQGHDLVWIGGEKDAACWVIDGASGKPRQGLRGEWLGADMRPGFDKNRLIMAGSAAALVFERR